MRTFLWALVLTASALAPVRAATAEDASEPAHGQVEAVGPTKSVYVNEPFSLVLRVSIDRAFFEKSAVALFPEHLDVPIQVTAPWARTLPGARPLPEPGTVGERTHEVRRFALEGEIAEAKVVGTRREDGRTFTVLEVLRRYAASAPGRIHVVAPRLEYAYATRFQEDFAGGRIALDRRDATVRGQALDIDVRPLPRTGRPAGFVDAVGRLRMTARLAPSEGDGGGGLLHLLVGISGDGNVATLTPPSAEAIEGFHVFGISDRMEAGERLVTYEIAPVGDARVVPPIALPTFDPEAGRYVVVTTKALPLPGGWTRATLPGPERAGEVETVPPAAPKAGPGPLPLVAVLSLLVVVALLVLVAARRLRRESGQVLARPPAPEVAAALEAGGGDPADALALALAARLGVPKAAAIAPDLEVRLVRAGVDPALAKRAATLLEAMVGARYGGQPVEGAAARVSSVLSSL